MGHPVAWILSVGPNLIGRWRTAGPSTPLGMTNYAAGGQECPRHTISARRISFITQVIAFERLVFGWAVKLFRLTS
jgi:hypothetical protein